MAGISNIYIEKFIKNETNEDIKKYFNGVYSSDSLIKYVNFEKNIED